MGNSRLILVVKNEIGELHTSYAMADIKNIVTDKACRLYDNSDLRGNGVKPNDSMIVITFNDGSIASFHGNVTLRFYNCSDM